MAAITEQYIEQNKKLHEIDPKYGTSGHKWASEVIRLCKKYDTKDVLDYGCGKGTLAESLPFEIQQYDPATRPERPVPADIVVCGDVMEHIEPDCLDDVISDLDALFKKCLYLVISTRLAQKTLPDGRNAHLIVESGGWWIKKLPFTFIEKRNRHDEIILVCQK